MARRGRPLNVEDHNWNSSQQITYDVAPDPTQPQISVTPILGLSSLLGSTTAAEYSQMQGFRRAAVGKVKFHLNVYQFINTGVPAAGDHRVDMFGFVIGDADAVDGTPASGWFGEWNPFIADVAPLATEANKDPYGNEQPRLLAYKQFLWNTYDPDKTNNRAWHPAHSWAGRLRKGFVLRESQMLYAFVASWHVLASPGISETLWQMHIGVPHRFLTR